MVHIHNGILLSHLKKCIWISSNEVDETGAYYTEWRKPERKTPVQYTNAELVMDREAWRAAIHGVTKSQTRATELNWMHIYGIQKDGNDDPICETAKETQIYRTVFWTVWENVRVEWFERIALKHVYYHMWNRSPAQVQCMRQGARGWCTGKTLRDGMGREVGEGFRMGNACTPMADSCQCMAKTTTIL